jgi:hypothetical protein
MYAPVLPPFKEVKDCFLRSIKPPLHGSIYIQSHLSNRKGMYPWYERGSGINTTLV